MLYPEIGKKTVGVEEHFVLIKTIPNTDGFHFLREEGNSIVSFANIQNRQKTNKQTNKRDIHMQHFNQTGIYTQSSVACGRK